MSLKLLSLNIEGDNHYDRIFSFFEAEKPDVICVQEFYQVDIPLFQAKTGMQVHFLPLSIVTAPNPYRKAQKGVEGIGILTQLPVKESGSFYYESQPIDDTIRDSSPGGERRGLLWLAVEKENVVYKVATTHFTWSPNASVTDLQRSDLNSLLPKLELLGEIAFCGDFNAPRGKEIFDILASKYVDNIPPEVTTSLDKKIHRAGDRLPDVVVDGLFTKGYVASTVRVVPGISDHCAIIGSVEKSV